MKWIVILGLVYPVLAFPQTKPEIGDELTVTATRVERPSLDVPASIDRVVSDDIRFARPQSSLAESLGRVPGIVVQNRQNYAQDLQISVRGFGARSTFGVRGLRLIADGIPASFPDGQGQVTHFDLGTADRIEVLRGPFSVMYGNAAGGVINVVTESGLSYAGRNATAIGGDFSLGSFNTRREAFRAGGTQDQTDWIFSGSRFHTDGYRQHSSANRDQFNTKVIQTLESGATLTLVGNYLNAPEALDPLGLTRVQMNIDPRQVAATALTFDTRKSLRQSQAGAVYADRLGDWLLNVSAYGGHRDVRQYLAIPLTPTGQLAATSSGGVVDLDRSFGGGALRLTRSSSLLGRPFTLNIGTEYETMDEVRKGYINNNGSLTTLKRNENDYVTAFSAYAQGEWRFAEKWFALGGVRANSVPFRVADHYIAPGNGDDSGGKRYSAVTPVLGLLYKVTPVVSVYANAGTGFETPTFAELSYQIGKSGPNFSLQASNSQHAEVGVKAIVAERLRVNAAVFDIQTRDEIAIQSNLGGRSTFQNVGRTSRTGFELGANAVLPYGFDANLAWTRLSAKFLDTFNSVANTPAVAVTVPAGSTLPGVPRAVLYAELRWRFAPAGFTTALEFQHKARVWVDDRNSEAADTSNVFNYAAAFTQLSGKWRLTEYFRVDNLTNRRYAGSVVVNDANLRFYEPAPGRATVAGIQAKYGF